ncbi:Uu.00g122760.m01.CDS01 [Anthostomella pinea]|uniref:Uu.00g122760.m01.CDS01 n=1 Tax=Anthostomella pinea TaxID=933095 RepID=A0AAI8VC03_9PEZI|nr:Uu.00g122760.m01.CDS01 [Anthostomella pinea]
MFKIYIQMFEHENPSTPQGSTLEIIRATYPHFHRGNLAALLKVVSHKVETDWTRMCVELLELISHDRMLLIGNNYVSELCAQLHMQQVYTDPWLQQDIRRDLPLFRLWKSIPEVVAITLVIPRERFSRLFSQDKALAAPIVQGVVSSSPNAPRQWLNLFADVQVMFGTAKPTADRRSEDFALTVYPDPEGWLGNDPVVASFYMPTVAFQVEPQSARVALGVQGSPQSFNMFSHILGGSLNIYETTTGDEEHVFVTKYLPHQSGYPVTCAKAATAGIQTETLDTKLSTSLTANVKDLSSTIVSLTGRVDIPSNHGKALLTSGAPVELTQSSPFTIDLVFGEGNSIHPMRYPMPVLKDNSKLRIARKLGYVEVIAPVAQPATTEPLADYIYPSNLGPASLPATTNISHVNLDRLPILKISDKNDLMWMASLSPINFLNAKDKCEVSQHMFRDCLHQDVSISRKRCSRCSSGVLVSKAADSTALASTILDAVVCTFSFLSMRCVLMRLPHPS